MIWTAHLICNQSTDRFKAAAGLKAARRWCVTGTPIQNSMEDLRSLLKFLQLQPFASRSVFNNHIVHPLQADPTNGSRNLNILLRAICLRRNSSYLELPPTEEERIHVNLDPEETAEQSRIQIECQQEFEKIVSRKSSRSKYTILFTTILRLRQLCSYGAIQQSYPSLRASTRMKQKGELTVCELTCELCRGTDDDTLALFEGENVCPQCSRPLNDAVMSRSGSTPGSSVASPRLMSPPAGLSPLRPLSPFPLSPFPIVTDRDMITTCYSSKLRAVVQNLEQHKAVSKR
jgi:SWI/SNF-related matrix-associated actin-dependent regulator of chromatin subfamily A3